MKKKPTPTPPKKRPAKKTVRLSRPLVSERTEALVDEMAESVRRSAASVDASNARMDRRMEKMAENAEKDRQEWEKYRQEWEKYRRELEKDRREWEKAQTKARDEDARRNSEMIAKWERVRAEDARRHAEMLAKWEKARTEDTRKSDKILAKWEKSSRELRAEQEGLKRTFARMAEGAFRHNFAELMARFDIPLREDDILVRVQKDNNSGEYDLVGVNCDTTVITEVKSRFTAKHITELRGKLARFRLEHPELVRKRLVGVAAGLSVNPDAADLARKFGFIVLQLNGAAIASKTPANFTPASY